jgi:GTP-binding nuclear protein Ran
MDLHDCDNLPFGVEISIKVLVTDPQKAAATLPRLDHSTVSKVVEDIVMSAARSIAMERTILDIMKNREEIEKSVYEMVADALNKLGLSAIIFDIKNIRDIEGRDVIGSLERAKIAELEKKARISEAIHYNEAQELEVERKKATQVKSEQMKQEEEQARLEREQQARLEREQQARLEREQQARLERERQARLEREQQARLERERQARVEREQQARLEREQQARLEREQQARVEREQQARVEREQQARLEREHKFEEQKFTRFAEIEQKKARIMTEANQEKKLIEAKAEEDHLTLTYKICVFGDSGVGKTTFINRFLTNRFHDDIKSTLGAAIHVKTFELENGKITLQVWDFGGEDRFKFLIKSYAQGSSGGIFMFDLTNYDSLINIINWLPEFRKISNNTPILMVGSKLDLEELRICNKNDALDLMELNKLQRYFECSSKTGNNVEAIFRVLVNDILTDKGYNHLILK